MMGGWNKKSSWLVANKPSAEFYKWSVAHTSVCDFETDIMGLHTTFGLEIPERDIQKIETFQSSDRIKCQIITHTKLQSTALFSLCCFFTFHMMVPCGAILHSTQPCQTWGSCRSPRLFYSLFVKLAFIGNHRYNHICCMWGLHFQCDVTCLFSSQMLYTSI